MPSRGYFHTQGGGFITGSAEMVVGDLLELAQVLDCTIVTVDYRLAPETAYAGSIDDNYRALRWMYRNAADLGIDSARSPCWAKARAVATRRCWRSRRAIVGKC